MKKEEKLRIFDEHCAKHGGVFRPHEFVEAAREEGHPAHGCFLWDDEAAGHRYRLAQARDYLNGLHERFARLAEQPMLGRSVSRLSSGLRRHAYRSHVMFYVPQDGGVTIVRVLHWCMDAPRHLQEDEGGQ